MRYFVTSYNNLTPVVNATATDVDWAGLGKVVEAADPVSAINAYAVKFNAGALAPNRAYRVIEADLVLNFPVSQQPALGTVETYSAPAIS